LILTRMGDGSFIEMSEAEIRKEIEAGVEEGAKKAKCPPLTEDDVEKLSVSQESLSVWKEEMSLYLLMTPCP